MPRTLLAKDADILVTMDGGRREIRGGSVYVEDNVIASIGAAADMPASADVVIDLAGHVVLPGLVNTHHHMFQSLTRAMPAVQDASLFDWLTGLYPLWARLTPEMIRVSTQTAMAELLLSGCTTSSDHLYVFPNGCRLDDEIEAARTMGMRFHATRGCMSLGESQGGLPPDAWRRRGRDLADSRRVIEMYHDPRHAHAADRRRPCSPFSVSRDLMRESAALARALRRVLHTHLAETTRRRVVPREVRPPPARVRRGPRLGGRDVWHAHAVQLNDRASRFSPTPAPASAHCPCSNMRLAGHRARSPDTRRRRHVRLGVDGCARNDSGHSLAEARQAMLLQRVAHGRRGYDCAQALVIGTLGGAAVLGRDDVVPLGAGHGRRFCRLRHVDGGIRRRAR